MNGVLSLPPHTLLLFLVYWVLFVYLTSPCSIGTRLLPHSVVFQHPDRVCPCARWNTMTSWKDTGVYSRPSHGGAQPSLQFLSEKDYYNPGRTGLLSTSYNHSRHLTPSLGCPWLRSPLTLRNGDNVVVLALVMVFLSCLLS